MRKSLLIVAAALFFVACGHRNRVPRAVLPQKKMQAVLWDMMRADQFLTDYVFNRDTAANHDTESIKLYREILSIHKISKRDFERSFNYYNEHPALLMPIMDSLAIQRSPPPALLEKNPDSSTKNNKQPVAE